MIKKSLYDSTIRIVNSVSNFVNPLPRPSTLFVKDRLNNDGLNIVEIGVDLGFNALSMLKTLDIKRLYLIDPYDGYSDGHYIFNKNDDHFLKAQRLLKRYRNQIMFMKNYSSDVVDNIPNDLDFVYIDGNHGYDSVIMDINNYYPKVKTGGVLGGHDFVANYLGVCKAVMDFVNRNNLELYAKDMDWWVINGKVYP